MKVTVTVPTNWLDAIDGLKVSDAIEILSGYDQNLRLSAYAEEGGFCSTGIGSHLFYEREETPEERMQRRVKFLCKELDLYRKALSGHTKEGFQGGITRCSAKIELYQTELSQLQENLSANPTPPS